VGANTYAAAPNIKPGLWEVQVKNALGGTGTADMSKMQDAMKKMQERVAKMPPEQRRMMEEKMGKMNSMGVDFGDKGMRVCISADQIKNQGIPMQQENCTTKIKSSSATRWVIASSCTKPVTSGEAEVIFESPTHYTTSMKGTVTTNGETKPYSISTDSKFVSADCGNIKPQDPNKMRQMKEQMERQSGHRY
jgi:hypothetical protein